MTNAQTQFLKDKSLSEKWTAMAFSDEFQKVLIHCRAAITEETTRGSDVMYGVNLLATMLVSICETQEPSSPSIGSGIIQNLAINRTDFPPKAK